VSVERTVFASAARTATPTPVPLTVSYARGLALVIDVTAIVTAPSVTVAIEAFDATSGKWVALLTSAAITAVGTTVLRIYPGLAVAANLSANDVLWEQIRVTPTHANGNSITYSISAHLIQ
jgi:hypothetical protein